MGFGVSLKSLKHLSTVLIQSGQWVGCQLVYKWTTHLWALKPFKLASSVSGKKHNSTLPPRSWGHWRQHSSSYPSPFGPYPRNTLCSLPNGMATYTLSVEHLKVRHTAQFLHVFEKESGDEMGSINRLSTSDLQIRQWHGRHTKLHHCVDVNKADGLHDEDRDAAVPKFFCAPTAWKDNCILGKMQDLAGCYGTTCERLLYGYD